MNKKIAKKGPNFWKNLPRPFFALAPMANVTDSVFRKMIAKYGKPEVMWTEFVSADGLISAGQKKLLIDLEYSKEERPIVVQLFTGHPDVMRKAAKIITDLGFDGLDINMGCPDRAVEKQGGGAAMMKSPKLAIEVLNAAREGVNNKIPVSVKTRIGYNKIDLEWIRLLLEQKLPALTVHLRTRREMSDAKANWEIMPEIVKMRNEISPETLIIGNGDVESVEDGVLKCRKYGCDGVMIGRGIFGKPWFFASLSELQTSAAREADTSRSEPKRSGAMRGSRRERVGDKRGIICDDKIPKERLKIMLEHAKLFDKTFCGKKHLKNFVVMKKHFKAYVSGWDGAKELRVELMNTSKFKEVEKVVKKYL
jgi:nifR3 family TIM-barrel protein